MVWTALLTALLVISATPAPQAIPAAAEPAPARPFDSFEGRDEVIVDFWCRYGSSGAPQCTAAARDGFVLPSTAGAWLGPLTARRPDLADTGLERRIALRFTPSGERGEGVQDDDPHWRFWWSEVENPRWDVESEDFARSLAKVGLPPEHLADLVGDIEMRCAVRADRHLGLCIFDRPYDDEPARSMAALSRRVAANLRLESVPDSGPTGPGRFVRLRVTFDGTGPDGDPDLTAPAVTSSLSPATMTALYPARALARDAEGSAVVDCISPAVAGPLENCTLISEQPSGLGFGPPTVTIAETLTTTPMTVDGRAVRWPVRQRVSWRLP